MPCASSTSAPSTHPPVTDPSMRPESSTSISAPGSSGADPTVSTSLAATTRRPSSSHCSATSRERGTMGKGYPPPARPGWPPCGGCGASAPEPADEPRRPGAQVAEVGADVGEPGAQLRVPDLDRGHRVLELHEDCL